MQVKDIMSRNVVAVAPDTQVPQIARALFEHRISAVPVVDESGLPIGVVSEGDLLGRRAGEAEARRDWWLGALAEGEHIGEAFLTQVRKVTTMARDLMTTPVVTVTDTADLAELAELLSSYRIKRVPVISDGKLVGIVSRADVIKAMAGAVGEERELPDSTIARLKIVRPPPPEAPEPAPPPAGTGLTAGAFRSLVTDYEQGSDTRRKEQEREAAARRREEVKSLIDHHIGDTRWQAMLHEAREAAERGEKEHLLLRFPSDACSDGGRAVNAPDPDWPSTLRGEAAEVFVRWNRDLKPQGFHLAARVLDFPGGVPGDVGLFLSWGG